MIADMVADEMVRLGRALAAHRGQTLSTISTYAANEGKFLVGLEAGKTGCTVRRAASVLQWFSDNWPEDLEWAGRFDRPRAVRAKKRRAA